MSTFTAPIVKLEKKKHPNADALSIAIIGKEELCFQCVINTKEFENDDYGVHIPIDTHTDKDHPLLSFLDGKPVRACKLRGEFSNGLLLPLSKVRKYFEEDLKMQPTTLDNLLKEGKNLGGPLKLKKYSPFGKLRNGGEIEEPHPSFQKYTVVEHLNKFHHVIEEGELVSITEKLHGTSCRFALIDKKIVIGSRNNQLKVDIEESKFSVWHKVFFDNNLKEELEKLQDILKSKTVGIYGEIVGPKIQDLRYGQTTPSLFVYDILEKPNRFLSYTKFEEVTKLLKVNVVPLIKVGPFTYNDLDFRLGESLLDSHVREGIVIKPMVEKYVPEMGRVVVKIISEQYLQRKNQEDNSND
jgi:RNA ligase (TIGR02306 family)